MTEFNPDVIFNAGAPIDVNKLNQLQRNISSVYEKNSSLVTTTNATIGNIQKQVRVFPIVEIGTVTVDVEGGRCRTEPITFKNNNFTETPIMVASVSSNITKDSGLTIRATPTSASGGNIEVCSLEKTQKVQISYIAVQMKIVE